VTASVAGDQEFDEAGLRDETGWDLGGHIVQRAAPRDFDNDRHVYVFHCLNIPLSITRGTFILAR